MLMHDLEVLCNEPWCCILCWQFDMQFSYATHLAHPVYVGPPTLTFLATLVAPVVCWEYSTLFKGDTLRDSMHLLLRNITWVDLSYR